MCVSQVDDGSCEEKWKEDSRSLVEGPSARRGDDRSKFGTVLIHFGGRGGKGRNGGDRPHAWRRGWSSSEM